MAKQRSFGGWIVLLLVVGGLGAGGWWWWRGRATPPPEISTVQASRGEVVQTVTATGDLQPVVTVEVSSQVSGLIQELFVDFNSQVKEGQPLARIDPATYQSRLRQAEAELANTRASHALTKLNSERVRSLFERNLVSQQELDQANVQLAQADAQLLIREASVENAKVDLARCTIYAPIDGIVIDRTAEVGGTVAASLNAPMLFQIANDLSKMRIRASVAEADIGAVADRQDVTFTVDAFPGRDFRGVVSQIRNAPQASQNVVTYFVIIDVDNADLKLKPGMTANVSIVTARRTDALCVPNAALRARIPEEFVAKPAPTPAVATATATADGSGPAPALRQASQEERREIMREAGFTPGGPPSPEVIAKARELAKARGIELPENFGQGRGAGGGRRNREGSTSGSGGDEAPVIRTIYKLVGTGPTAKAEPVSVRLGISDGIVTEIIGDSIAPGDELVTSITVPGNDGASPAAGSNNPFGGGRRRF